MSEKPFIIYLSFPLSDNPSSRQDEAVEIAKKLRRKYNNALVIVPHIHSNYMKSTNSEAQKREAILMDLQWLSIADLCVYKECSYETSAGVNWERAYAKLIGLKTRSLKVALGEEFD